MAAPFSMTRAAWLGVHEIMDTEVLLATARSAQVPSEWNVWPLHKGRVKRSVLGWAAVGLIGLILFVGALLATVPENFTRGSLAFVVTSVVLLILAGMAFGGLGLAGYDFWRLRHADEFLLVITPDDYVMAKPGKVTHVPMDSIGYVTLKGVKSPQEREMDRYRQNQEHSNTMTRMSNIFIPRRQPASAPSLAFVDLRDDTPVVVSTDNSFDDLYVIQDVLQYLVEAKHRSRPA
jgi:hypothetical protein